MEIVSQSKERYYNSSEHRSSVTRISSSKSSVRQASRHYEKSETGYDKGEASYQDFNSNYSHIEDFESQAASVSQSSNAQKRSSIPVLKGSSLGSPAKQGYLASEEEERKEDWSGGERQSGEGGVKEAKSEKKVKRRLVRKVKKRGVSEPGLGKEEAKSSESSNQKESSPNQIESSASDQSESRSAPRILISSKDQPVKPTTVQLGQKEPVHIKFTRPVENQSDEEPKQKRRERPQRAKTAPVTLKIKPPEPELAESPESESESSEDEGKEKKDNRTSIRIVPANKTNAEETQPEKRGRKLEIEAKSTKRESLSPNASRNILSRSNEELETSFKANEIYREKTRRLTNRKVLQRRSIQESDLKVQRIQESQSATSQGRYKTLPRNFKTVRLPLQTNKSAAVKNDKERGLSVDFKRKERELSTDSYDGRSETPQSVTSTQSYDHSPRRKLKHSCRLDGIHFEDDEDRPRLIRKAKQNRRLSNPNQILGRTDIQGLRKERPKSEVIGLRRSLSLPRSSERPRVKSESYNEFVTIHDFEDFNLSRSRTLPNRKKRVSYQEGTKGERSRSQERVQETGQRATSATEVEQAKNIEFERHLKEHNSFKESIKNSKRNHSHKRQEIETVGEEEEIEVFENSDDKRSKDVTDGNLKVNKEGKVKESQIRESVQERKERVEEEQEVKRDQGGQVKRSQSLPRQQNKTQFQLNEKEKEFDEFIRNQRNLLLQQLQKTEQVQKSSFQESKVQESKSQSSGQSVIKEVKGQEDQTEKRKVSEQVIESTKQSTENQGSIIEELLGKRKISEKGRRHKSTNDVQDIQRALQVQRSQGVQQQSEFLLQNNQQAKLIEKVKSSTKDNDIIRVFARGNVIQLSMEGDDRERFEQRQREYEELQQRQQQSKMVEDDRYRYMNNEFDRRNVTKTYYETSQQQQHNSRQEVHQNGGTTAYGIRNGRVSRDQQDADTTQLTRVQRHQIEGGLENVYYSICTHYFYPEDHELIVNLHRYGQIQVPKGLSHEDTCIFYNHLYVYEKEDVFAETLAPIPPKIQAEVIQMEEETPVFRELDDETMSLGSSANQSYDNNFDDASSQYSSASRRERNLFSSFKAQQYYEAKRNSNNNLKSMSFEKAFDSTYETLRKKRKSTNTDEDSVDGFRAISPNSSSGRSDTFSYSKPRLLRRSDDNPGVGHEIEDDYPRWRPKSPTQPDRVYGLSVALPP